MIRYSLQRYRWLLEGLCATDRQFTGFSGVPETGLEPRLILRLDLDYAPPLALSLAEIHSQLGVMGTFFVLVSSSTYNIFESDTVRALRDVVRFGQRIGLHYHHTGGGPLDKKRLEREYRALQLVVPEAQPVVAWHNPEGDLEPLNRAAGEAGFISAYGQEFFGPGRYVSDSNCGRTPERIAEIVTDSQEPRLQVLLHPVIWALGGNDMLEVLDAFHAEANHRLDQAFDQNSLWKARREGR